VRQTSLGIILILAACSSAPAATPLDDLAAALAPREVRWQFLPPQVTGAFVGRGGRCFYLQGGDRTNEPSVSDSGLVAPGFRPLLLDGRGRLWCLPPDASAIYGVKDGSMQQVRPAAGAFFGTEDEVNGARRTRAAAYEDSAGRVWFGNSRGVQWLDGDRLLAKDLADPNSIDVSVPMSAVRIAEDEVGRLYFWARWTRKGVCGTTGFWMFDGKEWAHFTTHDGLPDDRLEAVCPTGGDVVMLNTAAGRLALFNVNRTDPGQEIGRLVGLLNSAEWRVRDQATQELIGLGRGVELELRERLAQSEEPEERSRLKMVLTALRAPESGRVRIPGGDSECDSIRVRPTALRRRPAGKAEWVAVATNVLRAGDDEAADRAAFVLSADAAVRIEGWPAPDEADRVSVLPADDGGLWIGVQGRGLFFWDGDRTREISDETTRGYNDILGYDGLGRLLLGNGAGVAAYWPGRPDEERQAKPTGR